MWALCYSNPRTSSIDLYLANERNEMWPDGSRGAFRNSDGRGQREQAGKPQLLHGEFGSPLNHSMLSRSIGHSVGKQRDNFT